MLHTLQLQDFKSFTVTHVPLAPLTLLVGQSGAGKSNLLDAVRILHGVGLDMPLADILRGRWDEGRQVWPGIRGGIAGAAMHGKNDFFISGTWRLNKEKVTYKIRCDVAPRVQVAWERLDAESVSGAPLFDTDADALGEQRGRDSGASVRVSVKRIGSGKSVTQVHDAYRGVLGQLDVNRPVHPAVGPVRDALVSALRNIMPLHLVPARMRGHAPRHATTLGIEGENLSAMVWRACRTRGAKRDLIDWLTEMYTPSLRGIRFEQNERGDVMLVFMERDGDVPAHGLSDSALRFLALLVALHTAPAGSLLLIDELETGLHPMRAPLLVEALENATRTRGIQIVATTHSPQILGALSSAALSSAVLVARVPDRSGTVARRLGELPHFDEIRARRDIEDMFTTGWLERAL